MRLPFKRKAVLAETRQVQQLTRQQEENDQCNFVGLGGFVGAVLRYLLGLIPVRQTPFPIITLCINMLGAFGIGLLAALCEGIKLTPSRCCCF